jgi:hypothetical protein
MENANIAGHILNMFVRIVFAPRKYFLWGNYIKSGGGKQEHKGLLWEIYPALAERTCREIRQYVVICQYVVADCVREAEAGPLPLCLIYCNLIIMSGRAAAPSNKGRQFGRRVEPEIILADEPTSALDPKSRRAD